MPRPLHAINMRNSTKTQNAFATPVGADLCVGPLSTSRFRPRAHTQVRPYKVGMVVFTDHTSEPGGPPPTGGLTCKAKHRRVTPRSGPGCRGTAPAEHASEPGPLLVGPGGLSMQLQTPLRPPRSGPGCRGTAPADQASEPGPLLVGPGGLSMQLQTPSRTSAKRSGVQGHCPCLPACLTCGGRRRYNKGCAAK